MTMVKNSPYRSYFLGTAGYWLAFGLITTFYPRLMDLFQTAEGVGAKTPFSDHVWFHGGLDIISFSILLLFLSRESVTTRMLRGTSLATLMPVVAIGYSYLATPFWSPLFLVAGGGCLAFALWGFALAGKLDRQAVEGLVPLAHVSP